MSKSKPQDAYRAYYQQALSGLPATTGINQLRGMSKEDITNLLNTLVATSRRFATMIPLQQQKIILSKAMLADQEFYGLNARWVYRQLSNHLAQNPHLRNAHHQQQESEEERERRNQEFLKANPNFNREQLIKTFKQQLDQVGQAPKPPRDLPQSAAAAYYKK